MFSNKLLGGAALTALSLCMGTGVAFAQSTGSQVQESETVVVTGGRHAIEGVTAETVSKTRATIGQEYISEQAAGQTILNTINLVPGVNFTNNDPYGTSGGNLRIRGFDGNRISLTFDGVPLNDSGNYAIFSNQLLDAELIQRATVNVGTTDVDSPTASATGGTVSYTTRRPSDEFGVTLVGSVGDFSYSRGFAMLDTGAIGPWDTTAFGAASMQEYEKWKGPGELEKHQYNARIYQDLGNGNFVAGSVHWNRNRNNFYRNITQADFALTPGLENDSACIRPAGVNGTAQNETTGSTIVNYLGVTVAGTSCTNYFNVRVNPSDTGNIRLQGSFGITPNLRFTIDPSFQYVLANGGGYTVIAERDDRLDMAGGNAGGPGKDLNADGDVLDSIGLYTPNTTNTRRYGVTSSLIWDITDNHRLRVAYTMDYARHRQTGEYTFLDSGGNPFDVFGGKEGHGPTVDGVAGAGFLRGRERASIALLNQVALEYRGYFFDDALTLNVGVRAPFFKRELDQMCYSQNGSTNVRCTNETPSLVLANGNVNFTSTGATQYLPPFTATLKYDKILPNVGLTYRLGDHSSIYASYAEGLSAPRTDNLYQPTRGATPTSILFSLAEPETTKAIDLGYRFQTDRIIATAALWHVDYQNRIVSAFDDTLGVTIDRNLGAVEMQGFDASVGLQLNDALSVTGSASWTDSEVQENLPLSATTFYPTAGKQLVETPDMTIGGRVDWDVTDWLSLGLQGKHVGDRYATDINDQVAREYNLWDLDARLDLDFLGAENSYVQLNLLNAFDEHYLGGISSRSAAQPYFNGVATISSGGTISQPTYALGSPRTIMMTLRTQF